MLRRSRLDNVARGQRPSSTALAFLLGLLVLAVLAERRGNVVFPVIDLATGCSLILAGALTMRAGRQIPGVLLLVAAASWFAATAELAGGFTDRLTWVHRALLVQA